MSAARALGDLEATEAIPELMKIYKGADYSRQYSIGEAIAKLVTKETLPQIMKLAKEAGIAKNITYSLSRGINQLGIEKALPELIPLLKDEDEDTRWTANKALGSLISIKGIPELVKLLKHENAEVRGFVAIELVELCQKDRIPKEVIEDIKLIEKWGGSYESRARSVLKELGAEEKNK
jgi:HEAT repeat protein